jgi:hypothetical protein
MQAAIQGAAAGAVNALMTNQNILEGALKGAISGGAGGAAVGAAGLNSRYMNAALNGATRAATTAALNGSDIWQAAAQGALAGLSGAATGGRGPAAGEAPAAPTTEYAAPGRGMLTPIASVGTPESMLFGSVEPVAPGAFTPVLPAAMPTADQWLFDPTLLQSAPPATMEQPEPESILDQAGRYASYAAKAYDVYQKLNPKGAPIEEFAPPERGDLSDEEYNSLLSQSAIDYLGLDPQSMAAQGLTPGTQEYLDYILEQADALIAAAFGGDPTALLEGESVEALQAALRGKTDEEMQALIRALNVKGVLGASGYSASAIDPFTGLTQELGPLAGSVTDPSRSAAMRGYAGMFGDIARMTGPEARMAFRDFLRRDVDLFDLRKASEDRRLAGMLQAAQGQMSDEDARRKQWLQYLQMNNVGDVPMFFDERF